tara:strand:+ start:1074 stop:1505 length:432 start_codon:yes stop_codon:yes gene_type:complete
MSEETKGTKWGCGKSHVVTRTNRTTIYRWGLWSPYFSFFFSKIIPSGGKSAEDIKVYHDHEGNFISFLLWGSYTEYVKINSKKINKKKCNWVNVVKWNTLHHINCEEPVYTIHFMGKKKHKVSIDYKGKLIPYRKFCKREGLL